MASVTERKLTGRSYVANDVLDVVASHDGETRVVTVFFAGPVEPTTVKIGDHHEIVSHKIVGALTVSVNERSIVFEPAKAETHLFEGKNTLASVRNGESAETVAAWLRYHIETQDVQGAVILDRAKPGVDVDFVPNLRSALEEAAPDIPVVVLTSDLPLGKADSPAEAHPFSVPEAPGKDRMEIPQASPWDAPLGAMSIYEVLRMRFLREARAVANLDVHDLLAVGAPNIFDSAVAAERGVIALIGRHCYPWRVRKNEPARFADHICVQFDAKGGRARWCIAPAKAPDAAVWRLVRIGNADPDRTRTQVFYRHMALRHPTKSISKIVPKTSLIEHPPLLEMAQEYWSHKPVRMPELAPDSLPRGKGRRAIVTTMKNEGAFILEWLAFHRAIGFDDILVYTNDCTDGTDSMLQLLERKGYVQHRENPFRETGLKPQHGALQASETEPVIQNAAWVTCIDVDEYVNIKCGDGTLDALFEAVPDANMISMTWRLFGNGDIHLFRDEPIIEQFFRCAPEFARKPHQAWGFKTLFQNVGLFKKLGVHRPKGLNPQLWEEINWVNGSGKPLPREMYRNGWRSTAETYGYDLVQLNHYAVRSAESFLVKRDRGRVNHVDRDQGLAYWFRMNNNAEEDTSVQRMIPKVEEELATFMADPEIAAMHAHCVKMHRGKIDELRATENYSNFFAELNGERMRKLAHMHAHFGSNVFLSGPECVPDDVLARDPEEDFFFTVEKGETQH